MPKLIIELEVSTDKDPEPEFERVLIEHELPDEVADAFRPIVEQIDKIDRQPGDHEADAGGIVKVPVIKLFGKTINAQADVNMSMRIED